MSISLHWFSLDKLISTLAAIGQLIALWKTPKKGGPPSPQS